VSVGLSEVVPVAAARSRREIWAVGGGKGGIGKSFITASLGWELASMGRRVVLLDADLGGANLHLQLGMPKPARTLGDFIQRRASSLEEVVTDTPVLGLRLVSGAADLLSAPDINHLQKLRLLNQIRALDVEVVVIDLGAGTSHNTLDFFLLSDVSILVVVPEPASVDNAYRFIKSALYRRLRAAAPTRRARELVTAALDPKGSLAIRTPVDLLARVEAEDAEAAVVLRREADAFQPCFVVNEVRDEADVDIGHQLVAACSWHLGLRTRYAGFVHHDDAVWKAVRSRTLFMSEARASRAAEEVRRLAGGLAAGESLRHGH